MSATAIEQPTPAGNGQDAFARRHFRRNAAMLTAEYAGFMLAISFVGTTTVMPTFVTALGGSAFLVGLIGTFQTAGWLLPQLVGASLCAGKPRMLPYVLGPLYVGRPVFLAVAAATLLLGAGQPWLILAVLYLAILVFYATDGLSSVPWFELVGRVIPPDRRGRLFGAGQMLGGLGGMAAGGLVGQILARPDLPFPNSYAVLFALSGAVFAANILPFLFIREPGPAPDAAAAKPPPSAREFVALLLPILRTDGNFVRLVAARLLFAAVFNTFPFYVLYVQRGFAPGPERLGLFVSAQVFGGVVGGLAIGWLADHYGTKVVIGLSGLLVAAIPGLALAMPVLRDVSGDLLLAAGVLLFALIGMGGAASMIGFLNYLLEVAPLDLRSTYVGLFNTLAGLLLVVPPLAGWLIEATSFATLFAVSIGCAALSLLAGFALREQGRDG